MLTTIVRTVILYIFIIAAVRIMGKRQIGELQPTELVITILLSEIAAIPMQNNHIPIVNSFVAVMVLISLEIISSCIAMKSGKYRKITQGNSIYIIRDGKIDQKELKRLRFTVDDIMEALRQKDVFSIEDVEYAIVETNGTLSVMLKQDKMTITPEHFGRKMKEKGIQCVVVSDGRIVKDNFKNCNMTLKKLKYILVSQHLRPEDILLMTINRSGEKVIVRRDESA